MKSPSQHGKEAPTLDDWLKEGRKSPDPSVGVADGSYHRLVDSIWDLPDSFLSAYLKDSPDGELRDVCSQILAERDALTPKTRTD